MRLTRRRILAFEVILLVVCFTGCTGKNSPPVAKQQNVFDLLEQKKIELEVSGNASGSSVNLKVKRLVDDTLDVEVPACTYFVSKSGVGQNMVATGRTRFKITKGEWQKEVVLTSCANMKKRLPYPLEPFAMERTPENAELIKLISHENHPGQAAIWVVTDDATYKDMGVLVEKTKSPAPGVPGGSRRVLGYRETAAAMRSCDNAGIDITKKAIWKEREMILAGLRKQGGDVALIQWLEKR